MATYFPIATAEGQWRSEVEGLLTPNAVVVSRHLSDLARYVHARDLYPTFGAELEMQFVPDPEAATVFSSPRDKEFFYEEIVSELKGWSPTDRTYTKGQIVHPKNESGPILLSEPTYHRGKKTYNPNQGGTDILEVQTTPSENPEVAAERYWKVVSAAGRVAALHGQMVMFLNTHMNFAGMRKFNSQQPSFLDFTVPGEGGEFLAGLLYYLNALRPLQLEAGMGYGAVVQEAIPSKNARTAIDVNRIEERHASIGLIDPRIDILAGLNAAKDLVDKTIAPAALDKVHACNYVGIGNMPDAFDSLVVWDQKLQRLVMAANLDPSAYNSDYEIHLRQLAELFTGVEQRSIDYDTYTSLLRPYVDAMRCRPPQPDNPKSRKMYADPNSPHRAIVDGLIGDEWCRLEDDWLRVLPEILYDSPEAQLERRSNILRSAIARKALGPIASVLTPAARAMQEREALTKSMAVDKSADEDD